MLKVEEKLRASLSRCYFLSHASKGVLRAISSLLVISFAANLPTTRRARCPSPFCRLKVQMPLWQHAQKKNPKTTRCSQMRCAADSKKLLSTKKWQNQKYPSRDAAGCQQQQQQQPRPCCFASNLSPLRCLTSLTHTAHTWEIYHNEYLMWRSA